MSTIGVVVLTHNRILDLAATLAHMCALPERPRLVVVDNASTDGTAELVHSRFPDVDLVRLDVNAGAAGRNAGVGRLVYLGGMNPEEDLSPHLRSRAEVGRIMLDAGVPAVWLRAAVIIGSGSASFEMLRYLTERLPVMVTPRWVHSRIQPIAIRDVLHYLVASAGLPARVSRGFDIGGPDVLTYLEMMRRYAAVAGLRPRLIIPVPVLSPWLSSLWVGAITPVSIVLAQITDSIPPAAPSRCPVIDLVELIASFAA